MTTNQKCYGLKYLFYDPYVFLAYSCLRGNFLVTAGKHANNMVYYFPETSDFMFSHFEYPKCDHISSYRERSVQFIEIGKLWWERNSDRQVTFYNPGTLSDFQIAVAEKMSEIIEGIDKVSRTIGLFQK